MLGKVLVVEDDDFTRLSLCASLELRGVPNLSADSAATALDLATREPISAALIDLHLGAGPNGLDLARELRLKNQSVGLVFLSSFSSPRLLIPNAELPEGATYLTKRKVRDTDVLIRAINMSLRGEIAPDQERHPLNHLSTSQLETLRLLAQGLSNQEIAKRRFVTERSVEKTISRIAKTLNLAGDSSQNQRVLLAKSYLRESGRSDVEES